MDTQLFDSLREFVNPQYGDKDSLENLDHVKRIITQARSLAEAENLEIDDNIIVFGAYLHELIFINETEIRDFLFSIGLEREFVIKVMKTAWESGKEAKPETTEGALLHDAHLIEGGQEYQVAKWLVHGAAQGQSLNYILDLMEHRVIGKYTCTTEAAQKIYADIEKHRLHFVQAVRNVITSSVPKKEAETK
ncbi:TPA: hypothetical protein DDW35_08670 [Candidatus Sumerlaeota bacterium]|jgi:uncharacterized protein|nr:hypothetical protein [Candidatus Sumerlaeota bacterium]